MDKVINYAMWRKEVSKVLTGGYIKNTMSQIFTGISENKSKEELLGKVSNNPFVQMLEHSKIIDAVLLEGDDLKKWATFPEVQQYIAIAAYLSSIFYELNEVDDDDFKFRTYNVAQKMCLFTIMMEELENLLHNMNIMQQLFNKS